MKRVLRLLPLSTVVLLVSPANGQKAKPDYAAWRQVKVGMSESDLVEVLGPPEHGMKLSENPELRRNDTTTGWVFWTLHPRSKVFPGGIHFDVFMRQGRVIEKRDPHRGIYSTDGKPTAPILLLPVDGSVLSEGIGSVIDLRWTPAAGNPPMEYEVQVDLSAKEEPLLWFKQNHTSVDEPYLAVVRGGVQPHRWRVRAKNSQGTGDWSEYAYFRLTPDTEQGAGGKRE